MSIYTEKAKEIAELVEEKQKAYGKAFNNAGKILKVLYPNGIQVEQYEDLLTIVRTLDKLFRIATQKDALGESPFADIMGYSLLALCKDKEEELVKTEDSWESSRIHTFKK